MRKRNHFTDLLFTISLFSVFVVTALLVVVFGADIYQTTNNNMEENYTIRTCVAYLTEKVRQNDGAAIFISDVEGNPALVLEQSIEGNAYQTWIFCYNASIKEVTVQKGMTVSKTDGEEIADMNGMDIRYSDGDTLLQITLTDLEGKTTEMYLSKRSDAEWEEA